MTSIDTDHRPDAVGPAIPDLLRDIGTLPLAGSNSEASGMSWGNKKSAAFQIVSKRRA
ncbi:MAG: hypothetical protein ABIL58_27315 [Pseudomonadota bacterium]